MDRFENTRQPDWDWWGRLWPTPGDTLRRLGLRSGQSVVELGSGNGYFTLPAARITDPGTVYAIDVDEPLLAELDDLAAQHGIDNVETIHGDARMLPNYIPRPVDRVLLFNMLHGVSDTDRVLGYSHDVLDDDGELVVVNWHAHPPADTPIDGDPRGPPAEKRLTPDDTERLVTTAADFTLDRHIDLPPHHYGLIFTR